MHACLGPGSGDLSPADIGVFQRLLQAQSLDPNLSDAVLDWIDADGTNRPYGTTELAGGKALPPVSYGIKSSYFEVAIDTQFGRYQRATLALLYRPAGGPVETLWHGQRLPFNTSATDTAEKP